MVKLCEMGKKAEFWKLCTVCTVVKGMDSGVRQNWSIKSSYYSFQKTALGFVDPVYCIFVFSFH